jgi:hypothetical protein
MDRVAENRRLGDYYFSGAAKPTPTSVSCFIMGIAASSVFAVLSTRIYDCRAVEARLSSNA